MKKVVIDMLGGDYAPQMAVDGVIKALNINKELELVLLGDNDFIQPQIEAANLTNRVEIIHTTENISPEESPVAAIKNKPNSSIVLGQTTLKERDDCGAFISAGSTGAVLATAIMKVGRIEGVSRPAICPTLPTKAGKSVLVLDCGANMDSKPINLVHFALMGDVYARAMGRDNPKVALLNVGVEEGKGNELSIETYKLLKEANINFVGNVEGRDVFSGDYDVVICDGFSGNICLKTLEGTASMVSHKLKNALRGVLGAFAKVFAGMRLVKMKKALSEDSYAGAIFIGCKKPILKAHGNSKGSGYCNAILNAAKIAQMNMGEQIKVAIEKHNNQTSQVE